MKKFSELFKKYRLKSEFETISSFGDALAKKGYQYEDSTFSHWQKGARVPASRHLVLTVLDIFIEHDAICTIDEANEFLAAAGLGYLTEEEISKLGIALPLSPFQVPNEIANFIGRDALISQIEKELVQGKTVLLYGPPGVGKTALAIKLGHLLRFRFPDGVLWYKVDSSNVMDILLSIARLLGEDISAIKDITVRSSIVRTLLAQKSILLIFDNISSKDKEYIYALLPNSKSCSVVFSSRDHDLPISSRSSTFSINVFSDKDILNLFTQVINKEYVEENKKLILQLGEKLGNMPLAVHIVATHINQKYISLQQYIDQLEDDSFELKSLPYEGRNLDRAINLSFDTLELSAKKVFISLGVFEGKDFSLQAVAFVNSLPSNATENILQNLSMLSLIEPSQEKRYRMHPLLKVFVRKKMQGTAFYLRTALYYEQLLNESNKNNSQKLLAHDADNIIYTFKKCYEYGYWDQVITLWNPVEKFLSDINETKELRSLAETIDTSPAINNLQKAVTIYFIIMIIYWLILFFSGAKTGTASYLYGFFWTFIPLIGGSIGMLLSKPWGLFKTNIGKAIFFIAAGLFSWASTNPIWIYYNLFHNIEVPYPSFADVGFIGAGICWIIGVSFFAKATGVKFTQQRIFNKFYFFLIPIFAIVCSYYLLLFFVQRSLSDSILKLFLDLVYPTMDIIILSIAVSMFGFSVNFFRGKYKLSLFAILFGFVGMYFSDFLFSYTVSIGAYYNGSPMEVLFTISFYLLTWGTLSFYLTPKKESPQI